MQKRQALTALAGLALLAGAGAFVVPAVTAANTRPTPASAAAPLPDTEGSASTRGTDTVEYEKAAQAVRDAEAARVAAEQAAAAEAARVAAEQEAQRQAAAAQSVRRPVSSAATGSGRLPSGAVPPNIAGTDQPDSTACDSSTLVWDGSKSVCQ